MENRYYIEAAAFQLNILGFDKFVHDFWLMRRNSDKKVVAQMHGVAMDASGNIKAVGISPDQLKAIHLVYDDVFAREGGFEADFQATQVRNWGLEDHLRCSIESRENSLVLWQKGVEAIPKINDLNLPYPTGGFVWPLDKTINSNTIFRTLGEIMDVKYEFPEGYSHIGSKMTLYPQITEGAALESLSPGCTTS